MSPLDSKEIKSVRPKGNQPWIFIEGLMVKLKRQHFGHLIQRADSRENILMLGKIEGRGEDVWMVSQPQWLWVWANSPRYWSTGKPGVLQSVRSQKCQTRLSNSTTTTAFMLTLLFSAKSLQSRPTLCDPMDYSPPDSSVCGILQARILQRVAIPFSKESSWPRDWTQVSCIAGRFFTI